MEAAPVIILVQPQMGENIGAVARAMVNFGLHELRLVAPRDGWPNPQAEAMATHGAEIIRHTKVYDTLTEAVADRHYVVASTARDRRMNKPQFTPPEAMAEMGSQQQQGLKMALVFGPERSGLSNEDIALCHAIVSIPADPAHASLNLAQSVVVLGYEWWQRAASESKKPLHETENPPAEHGEVQGLLDHLEATLDKTYFFKREEKKPRMWQNLRTTLLRARFSSQEIHSLRGMIAALEKGWRKP